VKSGVVSYGAYVPRYRIRPKDIGAVWGSDGEAMGRALNIKSKSVPAPDEDVITISVEAARACMAKVDVEPTDIGAIYVGSESHPYAVKPTATVVAEAIGAGPVMTAADFEFACKAGTAAIQTCMGLTLSNMYKFGMAVGADTSQGAPGDALEYSASAGAAAFLGTYVVSPRTDAVLDFTLVRAARVSGSLLATPPGGAVRAVAGSIVFSLVVYEYVRQVLLPGTLPEELARKGRRARRRTRRLTDRG